MIAPDALFGQHLVKLATLAARHAIAAVYPTSQFAEAGGLMSYGTSLVDAFRQVGVYTGRILKGAKPAELPVLQPTKFDFVINLSTAKALGLTIPPGVLAIADRAIEQAGYRQATSAPTTLCRPIQPSLRKPGLRTVR